MDKLAVVILNWNGIAMLRSFLPGVVKHSLPDARVYVADNGSTDNSVAVLKNEFPEVSLIELPENYGFAQGYNKALEQIEATYYVLLNSDVEIKNRWLIPLLEFMDAHPRVAACQPKLLSQLEPQKFEYAGACGGFIDYLGYPFCRGRVMADVEHDKGQYDTISSLFWATGAALLVRSSVYWQVGGLDPRFFAHMEEIDFCWRLRSRGYGIFCVPSSVVYHVGGGTLAKENPRKTFLNFRNNLFMLYKNLPQRELAKIMYRRILLDAAAAFYFLAKGEWANFKAVGKAYAAFYKHRPDFRQDRVCNLEHTVAQVIPERVGFSILKCYYFQQKRCFSQLKIFL